MNRSLLLTLILPDKNQNSINEEIEEMILLAKTLGYNVIESITQRRNKIDSATYFGKGKINSLIEKCELLNIKTIFINDEIEPSFYKNIVKICKKKIMIIDRTKLILDIFNLHAKTNEAKKQIELASLEYLLPRLVGQWTHLERQMGGTGTRGGPGEKQIEIDRRLVRKSIDRLKNDLKNIKKQHYNQIKSRNNIFKVALAGYTNSGKSTLLKNITGYDVYIKDQLFATLETITKKHTLPSNSKILLSDTVGFLRKLPHNLIASFRSTLSEIIESDLIVKVIDINSSDLDGHIETIDETLKFIGAENKKSIVVFNKIDLVSDDNLFAKINKKYDDPIMISAEKNLNVNYLIKKIDSIILESTKNFSIKIPHSEFNLIKYIYKNTAIIKRVDDYEYIKFDFRCSKQVFSIIKSKI